MERLSLEQYKAVLEGATIIERDSHGEKLLALPTGEYVKIFRRKRWLSSAMFFSYARRFVRNAGRLTAVGIPTVDVMGISYCSGTKRHLVKYRPLPGKPLREALRMNEAVLRQEILEFAANFIARLHHHGVYFRSLHFGNVIVSPDGTSMGLIDVADMTIHPRSLGVEKRIRNSRHMLRYDEDAGYLQEFGYGRFAESYLASADLDAEGQRHFSMFWDNLPCRRLPLPQEAAKNSTFK